MIDLCDVYSKKGKKNSRRDARHSQEDPEIYRRRNVLALPRVLIKCVKILVERLSRESFFSFPSSSFSILQKQIRTSIIYFFPSVNSCKVKIVVLLRQVKFALVTSSRQGRKHIIATQRGKSRIWLKATIIFFHNRFHSQDTSRQSSTQRTRPPLSDNFNET